MSTTIVRGHGSPAHRRGRRGPIGALGILAAMLVVALFAAPLATLGMIQTDSDAPSPAGGPTKVIAQGVASLPDQAAWRVVADTAEPLDEALPEERSLGFSVADEGGVLVNSLTFGDQSRLAAGEAAFVSSGAIEQRASVTDSATSYYRIGLVAAENAADAGGDDLVFDGDAFDAPGGNRDIDLVGADLAPDEEAELGGSESPALLLVTAGEITIQGGSDEVAIEAGDAATIQGDVTLVSSGAQTASFVAAVIGAEVPPIPRFAGSLTLAVESCAPGLTPATLDASACEPVSGDDGFDIGLVDADGDAVTTDDTLADGELSWPALAFGTYTFTAPTQPEPFDDFLVTDADGVATADLSVTIGPDQPDVVRVLFNFQPEEVAEGTITLQVRACPAGMTPETLVGDDCDLAPEGFEVQITEDATGETLTLADAEADGGTFTFTGLAVRPGDGDTDTGNFTVTETTLPPGFDEYLIVGEFPEPSASSYLVVLTSDAPEELVTIYNFTTEDDVATPGADTGDGDDGGDVAGIGSVTIQVATCPEGSTPTSFDAAACAPASEGGFEVFLYTPDGGALTLADAVNDGATVTWTSLPAGTYFVEITSFPDGIGAAIATDTTTATNNANAYQVVVTEGDPDVGLNFYLFPAS
ncbi:MAG: hypothetical protein H0U40_10665 [Chloroflexia bacterium]|nr:hypothetical protein [Chloroflexia bacterium]MDQ3515113.1 hypothetical protein [Chloroflexota bacterium]